MAGVVQVRRATLQPPRGRVCSTQGPSAPQLVLPPNSLTFPSPEIARMDPRSQALRCSGKPQRASWTKERWTKRARVDTAQDGDVPRDLCNIRESETGVEP